MGPPLVPFSDHDENFTMFDVEVRRANLDNHWEASITTDGKTFTARNADRGQAIADVEVTVRNAHRNGEIFPGIF